VDAAILAALVGTYRVEDADVDVTVTLEDGRLFLETRRYRSEILPESETAFFTRDDGERFSVIREGPSILALDFGDGRAVRID
jgi:hypothetical protein